MATCAEILAAGTTASAELVAACLQADAALQAARMQADATIWAGILTLLTGVAAMAAAYVAYLAAGRQVRLSEQQHQAKRRVYASLIMESLKEILERSQIIEDYEFSPPIDLFNSDIDFAILSSLETVNDSLAPKNWEIHSMLNPESAINIIDVYNKGRHVADAVHAYGRAREQYSTLRKEGRHHGFDLSAYEAEIHKLSNELRQATERAIHDLNSILS